MRAPSSQKSDRSQYTEVKVPSDNHHSLDEYVAARRKGVEFLLGTLGEDGSLPPLAKENLYYFRLPWTLAVTGEAAAANRVLDWIKRNQFTSDGRMEGVTPIGTRARDFYTYNAAILALGAHLRQRYDMSSRSHRFLLSRQNSESGGVYSSAEPITPASEEDIMSTAQVGLTCLLMGDLETAQRAGRWFERVWKAQPRPRERLYLRYSSAAGLVTAFPPERAFFYIVESQQGHEQAYYMPGIAAAFLGRLYLATGAEPWLRLAQEYQAFSMNTTERQFDWGRVCKSGWGSAVLYEATGDTVYYEWTRRLGDWYVELQLPDGDWRSPKSTDHTRSMPDRIVRVAEFTMHLDTIIQAVSVAP